MCATLYVTIPRMLQPIKQLFHIPFIGEVLFLSPSSLTLALSLSFPALLLLFYIFSPVTMYAHLDSIWIPPSFLFRRIIRRSTRRIEVCANRERMAENFALKLKSILMRGIFHRLNCENSENGLRYNGSSFSPPLHPLSSLFLD